MGGGVKNIKVSAIWLKMLLQRYFIEKEPLTSGEKYRNQRPLVKIRHCRFRVIKALQTIWNDLQKLRQTFNDFLANILVNLLKNYS